VTVGLGSRISGSSSSISSSTYGTDKIASSQPSSKVSKARMSSITVSSSTSIPAIIPLPSCYYTTACHAWWKYNIKVGLRVPFGGSF
jgi:hypothetical protein